MNRYKCLLSYDGTGFCGWQVQPNGISIQEKIEMALKTYLKSPISIIGAGRTDAGVHAKGQIAHFTLSHEIDCFKSLGALNGLLPPSIRFHDISPVDLTFHARFSATGKEYHYHLWSEKIIYPFYRLYRHQVHFPLSFSLLEKAAHYFVGTHDFSTFVNLGGNSSDCIRTIQSIALIPQEGGYRLEFKGNGFLYKMIRNIVGTMLEVASGKKAVEEIPLLFSAKDRRAAGMAVSPRGLFLMKVHYEDLPKKEDV